MRKTFADSGIEAFHEHQILELLLTYAIPRRDTNELAHELIEKYGSLRRVLSANVHELARQNGVGEYTATLLSLVGGISNRVEEDEKPVTITNAHDAEKYCVSLFQGARYECMYVVSLDKSRRVIYADKISTGTVDETVVYPRLVVERALRHGAVSVILAHNHPSGNPLPSENDFSTTRNVLNTLVRIGIRLFDHIIVAGGKAYSMTRGVVTALDAADDENAQTQEYDDTLFAAEGEGENE